MEGFTQAPCAPEQRREKKRPRGQPFEAIKVTSSMQECTRDAGGEDDNRVRSKKVSLKWPESPLKKAM